MVKQYRKLKEYSVLEINGILDTLRREYDLVRLVDVEECRLLDIQPDGTVIFGENCFSVWHRRERCEDCSSYRACMTLNTLDKTETLDHKREAIHSVPIFLEMLNGELEMCVIECVKQLGEDDGSAPEHHHSEDYVNSHDVLTQLYTQEKLIREIRHRLMENPDQRYLLVLGNIRNFGMINKLFGIEAGNRILVGIADILREECTDEEVYGRYRDDRFVLLVKREKFHEHVFSKHLQRVTKLVESPIYTLQVKLGIYDIPDANMPVTAMIEHADLAVNTIRNSRSAFIAHYDPHMMENKLRNQHIVAEFEQALANHEFHIYLQPQVRDDGKILGAEALVRWARPDGSVLPPVEFLNVLHQSELLSHMDAYVWEQAIVLLKKWTGTVFDDLYVSINADPTDFYYLDVPGLLTQLCRKHGVSPNRLRVEITETALVEDVERQNRMVEALHKAGYMVEIDDFGKGFSSLSLLKDIHADVLKIDMGFLQGERNRLRSNIILRSVVDMANRLNMEVITEGVETGEQVNSLIRFGCRQFQGFFFSRPIPVNDFETVVREHLNR